MQEVTADRPDFTYDAYHKLLNLLAESGYRVSDYLEAEQQNDTEGYRVILRHDIDTSIPKAVKMAELEQKWGGHQIHVLRFAHF